MEPLRVRLFCDRVGKIAGLALLIVEDPGKYFNRCRTAMGGNRYVSGSGSPTRNLARAREHRGHCR